MVSKCAKVLTHGVSVIICRSYKLLKMVHFLAHPVDETSA